MTVVTWIPVGPEARRTLVGFGNDELVDWLEAATTTGFDVGDRWEAAVGALAAADPALGALAGDGNPVGADLGHGPARLLAPHRVAALAAAARAVPADALPMPDPTRHRLDPPTLASDIAVLRTGLRIAADGAKALLVVIA